MNRLRKDERGGILALSALMIPVFIVMTAMVVDVGQWYTHKRQLQNRADSAAFAAGIEYARNWKNCVQDGDPALKASTARKIANAARQYAADPEATDYAPDALPASLYNANTANQSKLDVIVNSWDYTDDNDLSDDEPGVPASPADVDPGTPCFVHSPGDNISPGGGHWMDVRVRENDLPSLFGAIGLPLERNVARARIEVRPALSQQGFLPLAVPNTIVTRVQVRYFDECRDPGHANPLATENLYPVPSTDPSQLGYASQGGGTLWAPATPPIPAPPAQPVGNPGQGITLAIPAYDPSCGDYLAVGVQVRLASRDGIDLNQSCATLTAIDFADCFTRLSQIRVWNDGNANSQPRIRDVNVTGGCGLPGDGYFSSQVPNGPACNFDVSADVDWGTRDDDDGPTNNRAQLANFTVTANGQPMTLAGPCCSGVWSTTGAPVTFGPGGNNVTITLSWDDNNTQHEWPPGTKCGGTRCEYNGTQAVHRAFVGTDSDQFPLAAQSGPVALVRTSLNPSQPGPLGCAGCLQPGRPFANVNTGGAGGIPPSPQTVFPSVGLRTALKTGDLVTLRFDDAQGTGLLRCDPDYANGQAFLAFRYGCKPWYGANTFQNGTWWNTTTNECPGVGSWFNYNTNPPPFGKNGAGNPWRCVPTAPGGKTGQVGDWMAVATKNCNNINNNSCAQIACNYSGNYDGIDSDGNGTISPLEELAGWKKGTPDSAFKRVINLFVVPYQALKTKQGSGDPVPILGFASFFVMEWGGTNAADNDPCPDRTFDADNNPATPQVQLQPVRPRSIRGVFVEKVEYEPGPVDANGICREGDLTPCRVTLVR